MQPKLTRGTTALVFIALPKRTAYFRDAGVDMASTSCNTTSCTRNGRPSVVT